MTSAAEHTRTIALGGRDGVRVTIRAISTETVEAAQRAGDLDEARHLVLRDALVSPSYTSEYVDGLTEAEVHQIASEAEALRALARRAGMAA